MEEPVLGGELLVNNLMNPEMVLFSAKDIISAALYVLLRGMWLLGYK